MVYKYWSGDVQCVVCQWKKCLSWGLRVKVFGAEFRPRFQTITDYVMRSWLFATQGVYETWSLSTCTFCVYRSPLPSSSSWFISSRRQQVSLSAGTPWALQQPCRQWRGYSGKYDEILGDLDAPHVNVSPEVLGGCLARSRRHKGHMGSCVYSTAIAEGRPSTDPALGE